MSSEYMKTAGSVNIPRMSAEPAVFISANQAAKYSTPASNSGWSFSPGTFTNVPLL